MNNTLRTATILLPLLTQSLAGMADTNVGNVTKVNGKAATAPEGTDKTDTWGMADSSRVVDLDEVVVVSQPKESMRMRMQSLSSSIFTGKEIKAIGMRDLSDLSGYVPSFAMPAYGSRLTSSMYIRGIGSRVNNPAVGIYVDGIPLVNKSAFNFHTYQLARADVLRGPQGTLYGMNTEGGLVRLYSKSPMTYDGTDISVGLGTHLYRNAEIAHYGKISEKAAFSVAAFYNGQNGFFKNSTNGRRADTGNEAGGKMRIVYNPTDRLSFDFLADYQYANQKAFPYGILNLAENSVAPPSNNRQNNYKRNMLTTGMTMAYKADAFSLSSTTSYQWLNDHMEMDQDYMAADYMHLGQRQLMNALTQELSFKSNKKSLWQWTAGIYGSYQWLKTDAPVSFDKDFTDRISGSIYPAMYNGILNAMAGRFMASGMSQEAAMQAAAAAIEKAGGISLSTAMAVPGLFHTPQLNLGVFHESNIDITDRLTATIGLRYDFNRVMIDYNTSATMALTANVMGKEATYKLSSMLRNGNNDNYNQFLPKLGFIYKLSENGSNVYATVCKGYRAGGYNIQMFSDILQTELNANRNNAMNGNYEVSHTADDYRRISSTISYKPEESWNYELGTHLNLFNGMVQADLSVYYMKIRNLQLSVMAGDYGFGRMMVNAGRSRSCGLEASLRGSAADNHLTWAANYGLTHSTFKEYNDEKNGQKISYEGNKVPFIPMHTFSAMADYRFDISRSFIRTLSIGANVTAQGRTYWDEANTFSQPFYAVVGAHATIGMGCTSLRLWCRNLTDTEYNTFAFDSSATGKKTYLAQRGAPVQAGFDLSVHF